MMHSMCKEHNEDAAQVAQTGCCITPNFWAKKAIET